MSITTDAAHEFWTNNDLTERHREIAKTYEMNVERTHPRTGYSCDFLPMYGHCSWCATAVDYYEYNGPNVTNL
jgi:hypothetical protein